ncbi:MULTISPECIES: tyrosine-protein phosphatase [unclassified Sporolactobacillus]|uniref:tyrosine-protein phosphatase n=1 Tax=unclassified Sporolactobacillus TaxID=2628533 RepID=UPI0023688718|nr:tyrosine-protein phosphatase [Sporolactobacillus sp. CQH2019]MDD9149909.1 tyrosine-protein phosphatase [Sporolactobacillus sp. CQH2019]
MPIRRILLSSTLNTRDLGGYPAADGRATQFGRIIRSDAPLALTSDDRILLKQLGVTAAIDFRSDREIVSDVSAFEQAPDFDYYHCPFAIGNRDPGSKEGVPPLYAEIMTDIPVMQRIMRIIAGQRGGVLIHCAAGKDRTGVVSALLLLTAGVSVSDILSDYQVSYTYLRLKIRKGLKEHPERPSYYGRSDMEYMEKTLDHFFETYGNVTNYLQTIDLNPVEISALREKLLSRSAEDPLA